MPLLDHFRPPVSDEIPWNEFHAGWATRIADQLAGLLPPDFRATEYAKGASGFEIDAATFRRPGVSQDADTNLTAKEQAGWQPPPPGATAPGVAAERFGVRVVRLSGGRQLVAAIELVIPANKDRPAERRAFATKVANYLNDGVCVLVIDVVTSRRANLHDEAARLLGWPAEFELPDGTGLYATTYRPTVRDGTPSVDLWVEPFGVGEPLPTMPLRLTGDSFVPVDFDAAYMEACRRRLLIPQE